MAFMAAQAKACFDFLNWSTCSAWHWAQVSGVGSFTLATSSFEVCSAPWQVSQAMPFLLCLESFQSETMVGVSFWWQVTHLSPEPFDALAGREAALAEGFACASAGPARARATTATRLRQLDMRPPMVGFCCYGLPTKVGKIPRISSSAARSRSESSSKVSPLGASSTAAMRRWPSPPCRVMPGTESRRAATRGSAPGNVSMRTPAITTALRLRRVKRGYAQGERGGGRGSRLLQLDRADLVLGLARDRIDGVDRDPVAHPLIVVHLHEHEPDARALRHLGAEGLGAAAGGDAHRVARRETEPRRVLRVQLGERLAVGVLELLAPPGHGAGVPVLEDPAGREVHGVGRVDDLLRRLLRPEPDHRPRIRAPVELHPLRVVGRDERILAADVAALRARVLGAGHGPEQAMRLAQPLAGHAGEVVGGALGERQDLGPGLRRRPERHELLVPEPARQVAQDLEVRPCLALRLHRLLEELVAPLGAAVDALLLGPQRRRQDHVGELARAGGVERLRDHQERALPPHRLAVAIDVGERLARVRAHHVQAFELALLHGAEEVDGGEA